jgi:ATP-dependent helicase/DNAse subunit B
MARQDPLLLDQERQYLSEFSSHELRQRRHLSETEQFLFTLAVQSAREWVVFSYPYAEQGGDLPRTPSFFLLRAIEALSGRSTSFAELREWEQRAPLLPTALDPPTEAVDLIEYHLLSAAHAVASGDSTSLEYLPMSSPFFSAALHATRQRWEVERLTAFDGMIEDEGVKEKLRQTLFPTGLRLSASALETYARCPFRYFLSTVLGLNPFAEPEQILTLQPRERGALLHEILRDFFTRAREAEKLSFTREDKAALQHLLRTVTEEHFHKFANSGATGLPLLWEIEQERLRERLSAFLKRECETGGELLPAAFEVRFGASASEEQDEHSFSLFPDGPVRLPLCDGEEIVLRGRIDRIDLSPDQRRARIVDYKTGKPIRGRFAGGAALQLPLYLYAARTLWPEKTWESAVYLYVDGERKAESPRFTAANWESSFATLNEVVTKLLHSLRTGCFPMTPESCSPCSFPLICGGAAARRAARKQHDPRLEALHWVRAVE